MTTRRDNKRKQDEARSAKRPKLKKETLRDLEAKDKGEGVQGGAYVPPSAFCAPPSAYCKGR